MGASEAALSLSAYPFLAVFHLFPLHMPITLLWMDAPFGRFSWDSVLNFSGNVAWSIMELVSVRYYNGLYH